jgi:hypothetical protein
MLYGFRIDEINIFFILQNDLGIGVEIFEMKLFVEFNFIMGDYEGFHEF